MAEPSLQIHIYLDLYEVKWSALHNVNDLKLKEIIQSHCG